MVSLSVSAEQVEALRQGISPGHKPNNREETDMTEFEKLAFDYDQFEYDFDTYGYRDAVDNRENGLALARKAIADPEFREQIIERLEDIAEECDDYTEKALALVDRIRKVA